MAKKAKETSEPVILDAKDDSPVEIRTPAPPAEKEAGFPERTEAVPNRRSVTLPLIDGRIDLNNIKPGAEERLRAAVAEASFQERFGIMPRSIEPVVIDDSVIDAGLLALTQIQAAIIANRYRIPHSSAVALCTYAGKERETLVQLSKRVLGKRAPEFMLKWGDEFALATLLANGSVVRFKLAGQMAEKMKAAEPVAASPTAASMDEESKTTEIQ